VITGIIVALPEELSSLTKKKISLGECEFLTDDLIATHAGTGPENAKKAAQKLIDKGCCKLISWGCAAGLDNTLITGDLCLPKRLIAENQQHYHVDAEWQQQTASLLAELHPIHSSPLCESNTIVSSVQKKTALHKTTGAIALDMESIAIAKIAEQKQIPYLVIRVIADSAKMHLPAAITKSMNEAGQINKKELALYIAANPLQIFGLIKLGLHFQTAQKKLKSIAKKIKDISNFSAATNTI